MTVGVALEAVLLLLAGVAAGFVGCVTGLASLVSYPALLLAGLSPIAANVTNTVALVFSGVGSVTASGPELDGQWRALRGLVLISLLGGAVGALLLLVTSSASFRLIVPWLVAAASLAVLVTRPVVPAAQHGPGELRVTRTALAGSLLVTVYGGYFGAGAGVIMIVLFEAVLASSFARSNAVKNLSLALSNLVAAVIFAFASPVDWWAALPLAVGFFYGGRLGPRAVRAVPVRLLKIVICLLGLVLAGWLGASAY